MLPFINQQLKINVAEKKSLNMLRISQVEKMVGIKKSTIYDWLDETSPRYDPTFPKQVLLREGGRAVRWYEHQIEEWLASRQCKQSETSCAAMTHSNVNNDSDNHTLKTN